MASSEYAFEFPLEQGLHARPASLLAAAAAGHAADVALVHEARGASADAKSPLALVGLDVRRGDACRLIARGPDAEAAIATLREAVERALPAAEEPPPALPAAAAGESALPRTLRAEGLRWHPGTIASGGVGRGAVVRLGGVALAELARDAVAGAPAAEEEQARAALAAVRAALDPEPLPAPGPAAALRAAHRALVGDPALEQRILARVRAGDAAARAVAEAIGSFAAGLRRSTSPVLRERAVDLEDLGLQVLEALPGGPPAAAPAPRLQRPSIVVADTLAPRQVLALDRSLLRGLVLERGGTTSHAVILARSFGIPALTGVALARALLPEGAEAIVDAELGGVVVAPDARVLRHYERRARATQRRAASRAQAARRPARTRDGRSLRVCANVSSASEIGHALAAGADGVGLFRTEMMFMDRQTPPTEDEQVEAYRAAVMSAEGRPIVFRTLDVGGDKPVPFVRVPPEANPFLGLRGLRLYPAHAGLLRTQLRAILRAAAHGRVSVMAPMVTTVEEARWFRERVAEARASLAADRLACGREVPVGVMVEVPAAALNAGALAAEVAFLSIGTNDLAQYFFAADREHPALGALRDVRHPAFLWLLRNVVEAGQEAGAHVALCGEMAGDPAHLPLLVGLGLEEISVAAPRIGELKAGLAELDADECEDEVWRLLFGGSVADVREMRLPGRAGPRSTGRPGLLDRDLVVLDSDAETREEAIEDAIGALAAAGRTARPRELEEAVWAREAAYSTGLGHGFAIPHAQTDAVRETSIVVVRCARPVPWDAVDGAPVHTVLLLAVRASDPSNEHLKTLAKLARKMMDEGFRERLQDAASADAVLNVLLEALEAPPGAGAGQTPP